MTATATHDTKRGEDARARLMALAEIPGEWASAVARWKVLNAPHLVIDGEHARALGDLRIHAVPGAARRLASRATRQRFVERMQAYALKAAREGKQETSWLNPHQAYEDGLQSLHRAHPGPLGLGGISGFASKRWRSALRCWAH